MKRENLITRKKLKNRKKLKKRYDSPIYKQEALVSCINNWWPDGWDNPFHEGGWVGELHSALAYSMPRPKSQKLQKES